MGFKEDIERQIDQSTAQLNDSPDDVELLMQRGKLYYKAGTYDKSLNDFIKVLTLDPGNSEARQYEKLICDIFEFRHLDYYNP